MPVFVGRRVAVPDAARGFLAIVFAFDGGQRLEVAGTFGADR